jgi:hypothetical protein
MYEVVWKDARGVTHACKTADDVPMGAGARRVWMTLCRTVPDDRPWKYREGYDVVSCIDCMRVGPKKEYV